MGRSILDIIGQNPLVGFLFRAFRYILTSGPEVLRVLTKLIKPGQLKVDTIWTELLRQQEMVMAKCHINRGKELDNHTRELKPTNMGDTVSIQNRYDNKPLRLDDTGMIMELTPLDKYTIKVDGSGRLPTRNRWLLPPIQT